MKAVTGSDKKGLELKEEAKKYLEGGDYEALDVMPELAENFVESSLRATCEISDHGIKKAIIFDGYGVGSTVTSNKVEDITTTDVSEEKTGHITAIHNGAKALVIGGSIVGEKLTESIIGCYLHTRYTGGRYQVRLGMLEKTI